MRFSIALLIIAASALPACASLRAREDSLCAPLLAFADSVGHGESREIAFHTIWGSNFADAPEPAIYAKQCLHHEYAPAVALCEELVANGASEFSGNNAIRVLECLSPSTHFGELVQVNGGEFSLRHGTDDRGSRFTVVFGQDTEKGGMVLRVKARGY
jgi:hypothetical protein